MTNLVNVIINLVNILFIYTVFFIQVPMSCDGLAFDFKEVIRINKKVGVRMPDKCTRRVYGGNRVHSRDLPYQVTIRKVFDNGRQWWSVCGGAIITREHVVTVAHCFADVTGSTGLENYRVIAGTTRSNVLLYGNLEQRKALLRELENRLETWITIDACHKHVKYKQEIEDINNVAVLQLSTPLKFTETIKPIRIITDDIFYSVKLEPGTLCLVSGYGAYEMFSMSTYLKMACIPIVDFEECKKLFYTALKSNITQLCAGTTEQVDRKVRKSSCTGDAGGPLVCQGVLVGVVTYLQGNCHSTPGIYALLSGYTIVPESPFAKHVDVDLTAKSCSVKYDCTLSNVIRLIFMYTLIV